MMRSIILVAALAVATSTLPAQSGTPAPVMSQAQAQAEVLAVVNRLWEAMRTNDSAMARSVFDSGARMVRVMDRNGVRSIRYDRPDGFVQAIGRATAPWIERMVNPEVRVDQNIASVWTWYDFTTQGTTSHCGYDSIELARGNDGWKIVYLSDTRVNAPCGPPRG